MRSIRGITQKKEWTNTDRKLEWKNKITFLQLQFQNVALSYKFPFLADIDKHYENIYLIL